MARISINQLLFNRYRVVELIATGGMGAVYKVFDLEKNAYLVMKVINIDLGDDPSSIKRFRREANAYKKLSHPNIVPFYGSDKSEDIFFILQKYIDGDSLKGILSNLGNRLLPINDVLVIMKSLCAALGYAHINGVVHCDIKPGNVLVDRGGNVYLTDFGIARHADSSTTTLAGAGTAAYMAPEQIRGEPVNPATDVYALGCMLFELLTGRRPFRGDEHHGNDAGKTMGERLRNAHLNLAPPDPRSIQSNISAQLAEVVLKSLAKDKNDRYQNAQEFFHTICRACSVSTEIVSERLNHSIIPLTDEKEREIKVPYYPPPMIQANVKMKKTPVWLYGIIGVIAILIGSMAYLIFTSQKPSTQIPIQVTNTVTPTLTIVPTFFPTSTKIATATIQPIPTIISPEQFIHMYYGYINNGAYDKAWALLSQDFIAKYNSSGFEPYAAWWGTVQEVKILSLQTIHQTQDEAEFSIEFSYVYKNGKVDTYDLATNGLIFDHSKNQWLINSYELIKGTR